MQYQINNPTRQTWAGRWIFSGEDGKLVEHWDIMESFPLLVGK